MAPITATAVGVAPQVLDDPDLKSLLSALNQLDLGTLLDPNQSLPEAKPAVLDELCALLEPWPEWAFEEQVSEIYCVLASANGIKWNAFNEKHFERLIHFCSACVVCCTRNTSPTRYVTLRYGITHYHY
jgi:hypothetical protein